MEKLTNFDIFYGSMFFLTGLMVMVMPLFYLTASLFDNLSNKIYNIYKLYIKVFYTMLFFIVIIAGVSHL